MVHEVKKSTKSVAEDLRRRGHSYSGIQKVILVPKATLSFWLKDLKLSRKQLQRLKQKRKEGAKSGSEKRASKILNAIEEIQKSSAENIKKISKRELWLMGLTLYWRERFLRENESDLRKGVRFTSSDPYLIKLFLKWLQDIGRIKDEEIGFDIFAGEDKRDRVKDLVDYWAEITGFSGDNFSHIYFQKVKKRRKRKVARKAHLGLLRVRVRASSMLARQIAGWIKGIVKILKL